MSWTKFGDEYPVEARELTDAEWAAQVEAEEAQADRIFEAQRRRAGL